MGIWDKIEAAKSHTRINKKNAGTTGTRPANSILTVRKHKKTVGSILDKFAGTTPAPQTESTSSKGKQSVDAEDNLMTAANIIKRYGVTCRYVKDSQKAQKVVQELMNTETTIGIDIETAKHPDFLNHTQSGLEPTLSDIRLIQLYNGNGIVYIIDVWTCGVEVVTPLLKKKRFVAHNAIFEMKHFLHAGIDIGNFECTMLMGNALCGKHHKLSDSVETYLDIKMSKELQVSDWNLKTLTEDQIFYAAADAVLVFALDFIPNSHNFVPLKMMEPTEPN